MNNDFTNDPKAYLRELQRIEREQELAKLRTLSLEFAGVLNYFPKLREELEAYHQTDGIAFDGLADRLRSNLKQAADLQFELEHLSPELRNTTEVQAFVRQVFTTMNLQLVERFAAQRKGITHDAQRRLDTERRAREQAEAARQKADAERCEREKAEAARQKAEKERREREKAEAARQKADAERREREKAEAARQKADAERREREKAEAARQKADAERRAREQAEAARQKAEKERRKVIIRRLGYAGALVVGVLALRFVWVAHFSEPILPAMVSIPAGTFIMGCADGRDYVKCDTATDELPAHEMTMKAFQMGKTEVTFAEWDRCEDAWVCPHADDEGWGRGNRPVINVSWNDVQTYIGWLNSKTGKAYRLPSEAEWEYAARAGGNTAYSWGYAIGKNNANCDNDDCKDAFEYTAPVGSFAANPYGLHDMHGNVWEWCQDVWHDNYQGAPTTGVVWAGGNTSRRVLRGGSWLFNPGRLRSASRHGLTPDHRFDDLGFRLVVSPL